MRRGLLTLLAVLGGASAAWAQNPLFVAQPSETTVKASADDVVARLMTFDHNTDGRVAFTELSERMRPLVARGDTNGDEALDVHELHALAVAPVTQTRRLFGSSSGYAFADDAGLSSRRHIEGALQDLRLTSVTTDRALPIIRSYIAHVENTARASLLSQLEALLPLEQYVTLASMFDGQFHQVALRTPTGEPGPVFRMMSGAGNLTAQLDRMALDRATDKRVRAAVEQYKTRVRLGSEPERAELLARLKGVLDNEELENYDAALKRRPVVATSFNVAMPMPEPLREFRERIGGAVPAVLIERVTPAGVIVR
jgi:hypothetical protein